MSSGQKNYSNNRKGESQGTSQVPPPYVKCSAPPSVQQGQIAKVAQQFGNVKQIVPFSTGMNEDIYVIMFTENSAAEAMVGTRFRAGKAAVTFSCGNPIQDMAIKRKHCSDTRCPCGTLQQCIEHRRQNAKNYKGKDELTAGNLLACEAALKDCVRDRNFTALRKTAQMMPTEQEATDNKGRNDTPAPAHQPNTDLDEDEDNTPSDLDSPQTSAHQTKTESIFARKSTSTPKQQRLNFSADRQSATPSQH